MNMNNLLFFALFADGRGGNRAGAAQAILTASNLLPEAPRTLLAVTQEVDRADQQKQQQKAVATREEDLAKLIVDLKLTVPTGTGRELLTDPRIQFMLGKLSDETKGKLTTLLDEEETERSARPTGTGVSKKVPSS